MIALIFSMFMLLVMVAAVGFLCVDFFAELSGHPWVPGTADVHALSGQESAEDSASPFELITPRHQTRVRGPEIAVIYTCPVTPPNPVIDDIPYPCHWNLFGDMTWSARIELEAGLHRIQIEECVADFFVETPGSSLRSPEQWEWNRPYHDITIYSLD